jgi:hypothetical protein
VRPGYRHPASFGEPPQSAGGGVSVHPGAAAVEQDRPADSGAYGLIDSPADSRWQRDQDNLGALTAHTQHPVTVLFAEIGDIRADSFEDPQAEQPEHGHQREVTRVR